LDAGENGLGYRNRALTPGNKQIAESEKFMSPNGGLSHRHIPPEDEMTDGAWTMARWERLYHGLLARHFAQRLYWPRLAGIGVETRRTIGISLRLSFVSTGEIVIRER